MLILSYRAEHAVKNSSLQGTDESTKCETVFGFEIGPFELVCIIADRTRPDLLSGGVV